jgi:hypothetical protein
MMKLSSKWDEAAVRQSAAACLHTQARPVIGGSVL